MTTHVRVSVHEARGLKLPALSLSADVFCMLIGPAGEELTTNPCKSRESCAIWDEIFEFNLPPDWRNGCALQCHVYHRGMMNDRPVGSVRLPLHDLSNAVASHPTKTIDKYWQLRKPGGNDSVQGEIRMSITFGSPGNHGIGPHGFIDHHQLAQQQRQQEMMAMQYGLPPPDMGYQQRFAPQPQVHQPRAQPVRQRPPPPPANQRAVEFPAGVLLDNKYRIDRLLGKGNFGTAYLATSEVDDQKYAVKLILCKQESDLQTIKSEAKILFNMLHHNIVRYFSSFIHRDQHGQKYFGMVMEYCENQNIQAHIKAYRRNNSRVSDRRIIRWTLEIADALAYMHKNGLQHRDLKADNVMVREEVAKVADFGLATAKGSMLGQVGALAYESPEQANHLPYDGRNDVWALGCLVTEMLTGKMVFRRVKPGAVFALKPDVVDMTIAECIAISEDWGRLVSWLLTRDVTLRPTAARVVEILRPINEFLYSDAALQPEPHAQEKLGGSEPVASDASSDPPEGAVVADGDPPPEYSESDLGPAPPGPTRHLSAGPPLDAQGNNTPVKKAKMQATLAFPEVELKSTPAPTKRDVEASSPQAKPNIIAQQSSSTQLQAPASLAQNRQPPQQLPRNQGTFVDLSGAAPPPAVRAPRREPGLPANHRSPWEEQMELALVTYYSQYNPEGMSRIQQKVRDLRDGIVTAGRLEKVLEVKYRARPQLSHIKVTQPRTIEVSIPHGVGPGDGLGVKSPHTGRELRVSVPPDHHPGMVFCMIEEVPLPQY